MPEHIGRLTLYGQHIVECDCCHPTSGEYCKEAVALIKGLFGEAPVEGNQFLVRSLNAKRIQLDS